MKNMETKINNNEAAARGSGPARVFSLASLRLLSAEMNRIRQALRLEFGIALSGHEHLLTAALKEAEALAWQTPFPHLFYPTLAHEKAAAVQRWAARQRLIRQSTRRLLQAA